MASFIRRSHIFPNSHSIFRMSSVMLVAWHLLHQGENLGIVSRPWHDNSPRREHKSWESQNLGRMSCPWCDVGA
ncbi:hypothetical protein ACOSP7_021554 [Xanthoceras sorbifolium]